MVSTIAAVVIDLPNDMLLDLLLVVVSVVDGVLIVDAVDTAMSTRISIGAMVIGGMTIRMSILTMVGVVIMLVVVGVLIELQ